MPGPEFRDRFQAAVLWEAISSDAVTVTTDSHGQVMVSATPIEIRVRWNDSYQEQQGKDGTTITVTNSIITNRYITPGSVLRLGKLKDLPTGFMGDGMLRVVISSDAVPDIKNRWQAYKCNLTRYRGALPPTA